MAIEKRLPKGVGFKLLLRRRRRRRRHRSSKRPLDSSRYCIAMFSTNVLTSLFLNKQKLSHKMSFFVLSASVLNRRQRIVFQVVVRPLRKVGL